MAAHKREANCTVEDGEQKKRMRARLDRLMAEARAPRGKHSSGRPAAEPAPVEADPTRPAPSHSEEQPQRIDINVMTPVHYERIAPRTQRPQRRHAPVTTGSAPIEITDLPGGTLLEYSGRPPGWMIETDVSDPDASPTLLQRLQQSLASPGELLAKRLQALTLSDAGISATDLLFMDIESTGLSNSPLFLIGVMYLKSGPPGKDQLVVRQFFARTYAEEGAVIAAYAKALETRAMLVTFNGKSYDVPFIRARAAANRTPYCEPGAHFDLLHESRRVWKNALPNCKLQTLESHVCDRPPRIGDIPGAEIPDAYHRYVRTGNGEQMIHVLKHNLLDLVTLADLIVRISELP